jgi:uncharacterized membrane protein
MTATYTSEPGYAGDWTHEGNGSSAAGDGERLAKALGVFSVGLGLAQVLAPRGVARAIGVEGHDDNRKTMMAIGFRELATGVGLLTQSRPATFAWGRVTGDAMDLALLGRAFTSDRNDPNRLAAATAAVAGVMLLDYIASRKLSRPETHAVHERPKERGVRVRKTVTVNRPPAEIYAFWRNFENLPSFMVHLESVRELDQRLSYWKMRAPLGTTVEWTAEIVEDRPNELISWRSVEGAEVDHAGQVRFLPAPGGRGTEIHLDVRYDPPAGAVGAAIAKALGQEPSQQVDGDLRRFKQVLEVGEVVHSDASIHRGMHPAQPSEELPSGTPSEGGRS